MRSDTHGIADQLLPVLGNLKIHMKIKRLLFFAFALIIFTKCLYAGEIHSLCNKDVNIFFDPSLRTVAEEVSEMFPLVREELEKIFGWDLNLRPSVLLIKEKNQFMSMSGSPYTVALAVPQKNLIVMDCSRLSMHPFDFRITMKHELSHLMLHHYITEKNLPRWLDEGICQWASDGIGDIIADRKRSSLNRAVLSKGIIPLRALEINFPQDKDSLLLAYEEGRSFILFIVSKYGKDALLSILDLMKTGEDPGTAVLNVLSISLDQLEKEWRDSLNNSITLFSQLSYYLYDILFALMAMISIYAFIKVIIRKRSYVDEE